MSYEKLRRALDAGLFDPELCEIVPPPSEADIARAEQALGVAFSAEHRTLLLEWGGSDLHEIVIHAPDQVHVNEGLVEFAADYAGNLFHYAPDEGGAVYADDVQSGETIFLAASLPEFINELLLGAKGEDFYGEDWVRELKVLGLA
ncbi:MAG TPA: SMI1/KNR4 family protein [Burkholderiales bacterium]|jgi:hypothetical protein|nr:SMI1/KNR4 family protein [Burkholderiales bacterium]